METFEKNLEKYAELAVKMGVNVKPGQTLVVNAPIAAADFVRRIVRKAYEAGVKHVHVEWNDDEVTLTKFMLAPDEAFQEYPEWKAKGLEQMAKDGAAFLSIYSPNPDLLKGVDPKRIADSQKAGAKALKNFRDYQMKDKVRWSLVSVPTKEWADKLFPNDSEEEKMSKFWDLIFKVTRVDTEDPVKAWEEHGRKLKEKVDFLNAKKYKKLIYKAPGTDLSIELPEGHIWFGGGSVDATGVPFNPNMPTEEVFTLPHRDGVNGTVSSTLPLNYSGNVINNFSLTFENGRIVDFKAEEGYETLEKLIETDEGAHYLGEVALVPDDSPISNSNVIFYNTLFDENASCHLAIGAAYPSTLEGGTEMSEDELKQHGANTSLTHVDFMIGSAELDIDAVTADGTVEPLFRKGNWAI